MTSRIIILVVFFLIQCSCISEIKEEVDHSDYLSVWYNNKADSLFDEFKTLIQKTHFCSTCDSNFREVYIKENDPNTLLGRFTNEAKRYCDSLEVTYIFSKFDKPNYRILLTTEYRRRYTLALDTILNSIKLHPNLTVDKYEQPELTVDGYYLPNSGVNFANNNLRFELKEAGDLIDLTVLVHSKNRNAKITDEDKLFFEHRLFGEELLLKKLHNLNYVIVDTVRQDLPDLNFIRNLLENQ